MVTIKEVAKRAGVSVGTVSNVIGGSAPVSKERRERVLAAIRDLDYHPNEVARSLKVKQTRMLGLVVPDITNPFFPEVIRGAENAALERGYLLVVANTDERIDRERQILTALRARRADGILLAAAPGTGEGHVRKAVEAGLPVVCLDRTVPGIAVDSVMVDNVRGVQDCVRHLIRLGHRNIAIITGRLDLEIGRERLNGYKAALREAGIPVRNELVLAGDFHQDAGYRLAKEILLRRERPSAIFLCNGVMTLGALLALDEMDVRCPDDIALATFDDLKVAHSFHPRLTAVAQPALELGFKGATTLIDRVEGKLTGKPVSIRLVPSLAVRESTNTPNLRRSGTAS